MLEYPGLFVHAGYYSGTVASKFISLLKCAVRIG